MVKKRGGQLLVGLILLFALAGTASAAMPNVTFDSQYPVDISSNNTLGGVGLNITYNITGADLTKILIFFKTNSSTSNVAYYQNGTSVSGYFTQNQTLNYTEQFLFRLFDNQILPATYNLNERGVETTPHVQYAISPSAAARLKMEFLNVSNDTTYNFFEFMPVKTGSATGNLQFYYCNSSYVSEPVTSTNNCYPFNTYTNQTYNHVHSQYSAHAVIPFVVNLTTGQIGTVKVTPRSYIILRPSGDWNITGVSNVSRTSQVQFSSNNGNVWNNIAMNTTDAHIHQFHPNDTFHYYVCANSSSDEQNCSDVRSDQFELANLPPTAPNVYNPAENTTQKGNITINYTASLSPNGYPIIIYNLSLLTDTGAYVATISANNSVNLSKVWDSTGTPDGYYVIQATACDNQGQCSTGYSGNFTIDNNAPIVRLMAPANSTSSPVTAYNFTFNVSDFSEITSCILIFNSSVINNLTTVYLGAENNFSNSSLPLGVFNWSVNCTDIVGFTANSGSFALTITEVPPSPSTSGGGGNAARSFYSYITRRAPNTQTRQEETGTTGVSQQKSSQAENTGESSQSKKSTGITGSVAREFFVQQLPVTRISVAQGVSLFMLAMAIAGIIGTVAVTQYAYYKKPKVVVKLHRNDVHSELVIMLKRDAPKKN